MIKACAVADLADGEGIRLVPGGGVAPIAVFHANGEFFAIDDTCTHQDASLADGYVEDCAVECPLHASVFDLRTGEPSEPPAKVAVRTHQVTVQDGIVFVLPTAAAGSP